MNGVRRFSRLCASAAIVATADKRSLRAPPSGVTSTFSTSTFEKAMMAKKTNRFHKKLRCGKASFLRIYKEVAASMDRRPAANCNTSLIKRVALTMPYLAVGSTMDQAASAMGVSRPIAVVYINEILEVLVKMAKRNVVMPSLEELCAVEKGFEAIASVPGVVGAIDGTLIKIPRPRDFEGWYCRKVLPCCQCPSDR
ncbi:hypothetical protein PR001_g11042 [Phytophthora rubi]|uniref:DDE Tnp4 domain-containing protein n=1 Tax=Phytophthora rubi TaxID=129364 RepID=A0A6A3M7R9_9STRA|nr:hypothetical protein PR002_g10877 [Phytophthora rubi]KAE9031326.1 hypothetical protein PR001_g11042 [Phytophthora rubi]